MLHCRRQAYIFLDSQLLLEEHMETIANIPSVPIAALPRRGSNEDSHSCFIYHLDYFYFSLYWTVVEAQSESITGEKWRIPYASWMLTMLPDILYNTIVVETESVTDIFLSAVQGYIDHL